MSLDDKEPLLKEFATFVSAFISYISHRLHKTGLTFEGFKNLVVDILMVRRGANTSLFVHASLIGLAVVVLVGGGILTSGAVVSGSYPGVAANPLVVSSGDGSGNGGVITSTVAPITLISDKPRDKILEHEVLKGETISSIANDFAVTEETIQWENDLGDNDTITVGDKLKILPVPGVAHKVKSGDTVYSVAKIYRANSQAILDFPFNDVGDDFALVTGDILIIPDGAPPEKAKPAPVQYLAKQNLPLDIADLGSAQFGWPATGLMAQYFSWYHPGLDISNISGGPIRASDSGTVTVAGWPDNWGYGNRVQLDHGNGYTTLYAHMSAIYVRVGQTVGKGEVLGMMGSTGRSTGTHLHIEIRKNGVSLNPLGMLGR